METTVTPSDLSAPAALANDVAAFFDALRAEQQRFLDGMARARALLADGDGQLAQISAVHGRLSRQFFDAQRLIMQRRAEADAEVAQVAAETDEHAHTVLASALAHSAASSFAPPAAADVVAMAGAPHELALQRTSQHAATVLTVLAARTQHDADSIERVINEAFEMRESEDARFERQLQAVLDEWWAFEKQESKALVDDARARAAMRLHVTHLEACQIMGSIPAVESPLDDVVSGDATTPAAELRPAQAVVLPTAVTTMLDTATAGDIDAVFAQLERALAAPAPTDLHDTNVVMHLDASAVAAPSDAFEKFWTPAPQPAAAGVVVPDHFSFASMTMRVVVPIAAITGLLAFIMAWMG